jgi:tRNA-splicing ligase RtcB (3'-phosphate/5'-hydroxy nucleic acid ligase)
MNSRDLVALGLPQECVGVAIDALKSSGLISKPIAAAQRIGEIVAHPEGFALDLQFGALADAVRAIRTQLEHAEATLGRNPHGVPSRFAQWGERDDPGSFDQMKAACELPVAVQGALMPDNHLGYGLPIGGVLGTYNSVIPYGVGVDIACRMMCTITDLPATILDDAFAPTVDPLIRAITGGTVFGVGGAQKEKLNHAVLDMDWNVTKITRETKDKARMQLGTSGSGNHFVEFGIVTLTKPELGLEPGKYVALLSHSGSRGAGAAVCKTYSDIATARLPKSYERFKQLAWLSLESEAGQEYWSAMNLMGEYASANHHTIHQRVLELAGATSLVAIENHHNFAWKEVHDGKELIVHRKGATPAGKGVLGVIPGSMADPAFIVRGTGKAESLRSASHGAGRRMSRSQAIRTLDWAEWKQEIKNRGVRVLSCGLDEVPGVYKDIRKVMEQQTDLVEIVARFDPKLVKMSDDGKNED